MSGLHCSDTPNRLAHAEQATLHGMCCVVLLPCSIMPAPLWPLHSTSKPAALPALLTHAAPLTLPDAETLRDDFRFYMPALLPKFVALLNEAERTNDFSLVRRRLLRAA